MAVLRRGRTTPSGGRAKHGVLMCLRGGTWSSTGSSGSSSRVCVGHGTLEWVRGRTRSTRRSARCGHSALMSLLARTLSRLRPTAVHLLVPKGERSVIGIWRNSWALACYRLRLGHLR